jgi:hypothetical protein
LTSVFAPSPRKKAGKGGQGGQRRAKPDRRTPFPDIFRQISPFFDHKSRTSRSRRPPAPRRRSCLSAEVFAINHQPKTINNIQHPPIFSQGVGHRLSNALKIFTEESDRAFCNLHGRKTDFLHDWSADDGQRQILAKYQISSILMSYAED